MSKQIGLLFTPGNRALVRAGVKTQTRRTNGLDSERMNCEFQHLEEDKSGFYLWWDQLVGDPGDSNVIQPTMRLQCPYGNPQVEPVRYCLKEPVKVAALWDSRESNTEHGMALIQYTDDNPDDIIECQQHKVLLAAGDLHKLVSRKDWRKPSSSMFMLKSFARTWLLGVRTWPERLGDMSEADAIAEGVECANRAFTESAVWRDYLSGGYDLTPVQSYASLWNSINGKTHPWAADLWTWAVEWQPPAMDVEVAA